MFAIPDDDRLPRPGLVFHCTWLCHFVSSHPGIALEVKRLNKLPADHGLR